MNGYDMIWIDQSYSVAQTIQGCVQGVRHVWNLDFLWEIGEIAIFSGYVHHMCWFEHWGKGIESMYSILFSDTPLYIIYIYTQTNMRSHNLLVGGF